MTAERLRFHLAEFEEGGVCLDFRSGNIFQLNRTAAVIVRGINAGKTARQSAAELAATFSVGSAEVLEDVRAMRAALKRPAVPRSPQPGVLGLRPARGHHVVAMARSGLFSMSPEGSRVRRLARNLPVPPAAVLRWMLPHLLALQGHAVLHAAALLRGRRVVPLLGASGAGKTTLSAYLGAQEGVQRIAQDLLLLDTTRQVPSVRIQGEEALYRWVEATAAGLERRGDEVSVPDLGALAGSAGARLGELLFLDARQRRGQAIVRQKLSPARGMELLLTNSFAELATPTVWSRVFAISQMLATQVPMFQLVVPNGRKQLSQAARAFPWQGK